MMLVAVVALTGWLVAASLANGSILTELLAIGVVAYGEIVVLAFVLSGLGQLNRAGFVVGSLACVGFAFAGWSVRGRPGGPVEAAITRLRPVLGDPSLGVLAGLVACAVGYMAVVALTTPQLDADSTDYHLPRAILWLQQGGIGRIVGAADPRLSWAPPGAETVVTFTLAVARSDRYVALPQLAALPLAMAAVVGVARRVGFGLRPAVFSGLLFGSLPMVVLQAPTALNDLVLVALLLSAFCFALGSTRADTAMCVVAVALGTVTKLTAVVALPLLVLLVLVVAPRSAWRALVAVGVGGAIGGAWFIANLLRTGSLDGGWGEFFDQTPDRSPIEVTIRAQKYVLALFDASGFVGSDRWLLPIAGCALLVTGLALLAFRRIEPRASLVLVGAGVLVATSMWLSESVRWSVVRAFAHGLRLAGRGDRIGELPVDPSTNASPVFSWYGVLFGCSGWSRSQSSSSGRPPARRALACSRSCPPRSPSRFLFSIATIDDGNRGRFFAFSIGAAVAAFGVIQPFRVVQVGTPVVVAVTMLVLIVHVEPRPIGFELLAPVRAPSVWGKDRFEATMRSRFSSTSSRAGSTSTMPRRCAAACIAA